MGQSGQTLTRKLPYPVELDAPGDPAAAIQALANALDSDMPFGSGTASAKPPATVQLTGMAWYETDTHLLALCIGSAWIYPTQAIANNSIATAMIQDAAVTDAKIASGINGNKLTASSVPGSALANGAVDGTKVADSLKPSVGASNATESLRSLGVGGGQAMAGNAQPNAHAPSHRMGASDEIVHSVLSAQYLGEVGVVNQLRAGRVLTVADFTSIGLSAPTALYNLSDTSDVSGNSLTLVNKGFVSFGTGILGGTAQAAQFTGSSAQALYISDIGSTDAFRIRSGSLGCWFKTAKRGVTQSLISKDSNLTTNRGYNLYINASNQLQLDGSVDGGTTTFAVSGQTDVCDDRWHFAVMVFDGDRVYLFLDGAQDKLGNSNKVGGLWPSSAPFNIGGRSADGSTAASMPSFGRIDEAFVTSETLNLNQVRRLMAARVAHGLPAMPNRVHGLVRRAKRGAPLITGSPGSPFPSPPLRLYNFTGGSLADQGANGQALSVINGAPTTVPGADGAANGAKRGAGADAFGATDTGLPSGTNPGSMGIWAKTLQTPTQMLIEYGAAAGRRGLNLGGGNAAFTDGSGTSIASTSPPYNDGFWHLFVVTWENAPTDGQKTKLYVDGKLVAGGTTLASATLIGANGLTIGRESNTTTNYVQGDMDGAFVCDYVLSTEQIATIYDVASQRLAPAPLDVDQIVEAVDSTYLYLIATGGSPLSSQDQYDLAVAA